MTPTPTQALEPVEVTQADERLAHRIVTEFRPNGWPAKEKELAHLLSRHRQSTNAASVGEPVALLHEHPADGEVEVELYRHGAGRLTDADKAAGWVETELFASLSTPEPPDRVAETRWQAAWDALPDGMHGFERARQAGINALSDLQRLGQEYDGDGQFAENAKCSGDALEPVSEKATPPAHQHPQAAARSSGQKP